MHQRCKMSVENLIVKRLRAIGTQHIGSVPMAREFMVAYFSTDIKPRWGYDL